MATNASGDFEAALKRLEEIVGTLERENVGLDESVALFREGKSLASRCERLLKDAQTSIESASRGDVATADATALPPRAARAGATLFADAGRTGVDDADPDL